MTHLNNISQHILRLAAFRQTFFRTVFLRTALCLALLLSVALNAAAQTQTWTAAEAVKPLGSGTQDDPYQVSSAANLFWISLNVGKSGAEKAGARGKYYVQTKDIDLSGKEWMPIGNKTSGGFFANYDGQGNKITGMKVDWGNYALALNHASDKDDSNIVRTTNTNIAYGLFGWFGGRVENLIIEDARIYRENVAAANLTEDLKIGVLAGMVSDESNQAKNTIVIRNIIVRNSTITDSSISTAKATAYMVGGLIGDVNSGGYTGSSTVTSNISISNVAVVADINLANTNISGTGSDGKGHQYNVGGIVGRLRSVKYQHVPTKAIYSGHINSTWGVTGPIFGFARVSTPVAQGYDNFMKGYDGEFTDGGTLSDIFIHNYTVRETLFTETNPESSTSANQKYTFQTLKSIANKDDYTYSQEGMKMFQGVNHGTYKTMTDADTRTEVLEKLNIGNENSVFKFVWNNDQIDMQGNEEIVKLERTGIFRFTGSVRNLKAAKTYTYKWTVSDTSGNSWTASCETTDGTITQTNDPSGEEVLKILSASKTAPSCALVGAMRPYSSIKLEVFDDETLLSSKCHKIDDIKIKMVRDIYTTSTTTQVEVKNENGEPVLDDDNQPVMQDVTTYDKDHFIFKADLELEGIHYVDNPAFFEGITFEWLVKKGSQDTATPDADGFINQDDSQFKVVKVNNVDMTFPVDEAHIQSTYVGNIRLRIMCTNPDVTPTATPVPITSSEINGERKDYIEQVNNGLHLRITMEECTINATTGTITTYDFNPADYYPNPTLGGQGFYSEVAAKYDPEGYLTGDKANVIKPLIFKVKVVDQFGNDWTSATNALSHYRIQWNYRIPGEGNGTNELSQNYDGNEPYKDLGYYCSINGRFDASKKDDATEPYGLKANIEGKAYNYSKNINADGLYIRGYYKVIGDSILIIHPNLLHRTSAFWVRAKLYDIEHDPQGNHPTEETLAFNQLGIKLSKNTTENTLEGKVVWKLDPEEETYSSGSSCILIWYKSSDPTNPYSWVKVQETLGQSSRETKLNPNLYDPTCFYKLYYKSGNDLECEEIIGPKNVVYVYDRAQTIAHRERHDFDPYDDFTNEYFSTGINTNHGHDPYNAVATMEQAYKLLDMDGSAEDNIVVVMGYLEDTDFLLHTNPKGDYNRNATITGAYGSIKGSTLWLAGENTGGRMLRGATKFENLNFYGGGGILHFYCALNDVTFGKGLKMVNYANQSFNKNGLGNYKSQQITIVGGFHNYDNTELIYPVSNKESGKRLTMTFQSGTFGRIISGGRTHGGYNKTSFNIFGHPEWPHRVRVVVDIEDELSAEEKKVADYNIGLLVGGQTDGSLYSDSEIEMRNGSVGRYISGNISYGRAVGDEHPSDTYFGSTKLDLYGGQIIELYGGTLGRHEESGTTGTTTSDAFFYGRSIINIHGGTINSNIYGAGAGGVTGLGDDANHTPDKLIPYYEGKDKKNLKYGVYTTATDEANAMPTMELLELDENGDRKVLDFANTYVEVNVMGGTIEGNIFGGGHGYSDNIKPIKAIPEAGFLFGNATVNISGGTINGNVYGGGAGSSQYNQDPANSDSTKFRELACVYGNTNVNISGGIITGSVYGGGQGILGFENMAKVTGNTYVNISGGELVGSVEQRNGGNVYGGASLGEIRGNTNVMLTGGYIGANVFAGSEGDATNPRMATIYGKTYLSIDGATVNASIYGGCNVSSIRKPTELTDAEKAAYGKGADLTKATDYENFEAMTKVIINSGTIGNNIYGGSRGNETEAGAETDIEGDTYVRINGGSYKNIYYITNKDEEPVTGSDGKKRYRDFNIFGGGEKKCTIIGTAHLDVRSGLMDIPGTSLASLPIYEDDAVMEAEENRVDDSDINIFIPHYENPNALADDKTSKFQGPYMDLTYRRFSIYGGGYGEQTNCLNTDVYVNIPTTKRKPHGRTLKVPYDHQSFFDIAGGGYSGDIGYWAKLVTKIVDGKTQIDTIRVSATSPASDYEYYVGGACKVTIDGFTYARKVIGGGFYGSCKTTDTKIICGSLRQAYGGSLLGYVHDKAYLEIGNRPNDVADYQCETPEVNAMSNEAKAKWLNDYIFFTENVYGGNDVKGIVGTKQWSWSDGAGTYYGQEGTDGGPLWQADVDPAETKGVVMNIFGGTFMGDVFGAGNGHYRGYYVPGWIRYEDGPDRMYRMVRGINGQTFADDSIAHWSSEPDKVKSRHRVYRTRPMVGSVNINITGNGADDMVKILGNFYGGGRECSIGQWNTILPMEDPRRLSTGGHLHFNVGGNVDFKQNLYMGVYGGLYGEQQYLPAGENINLNEFDGSTTEQLARLGEAAYDHWYFNDKEGHKRYEPGFPAPGEADGNFGLLGEHMFRGYFKNIEMEGDVELTFYKDLYEYPKDNDGNPITTNGKTKRRRWLPAELAVDAYDAENITMNSFFLGGKCGYMTNNTYNVYCYTDSEGKHLRDVEKETETGHNHEQWGSVYRIVMPEGVTIKDKLVMGVEDAVTKYYKYNDTFTAPDSTTVEGKKVPDLIYTFEGGLVTQTTYSFDHVAYNDMMTAQNNGVWNPTIILPDSFYIKNEYKDIWDKDTITLKSGIYKGKKIYRRYYKDYGLKNYMLRPNGSGGYTNENNQERRYGLAVVYNDNGTHANGNEAGAEPFFGRRASRTASGDHQTVTKLTARCKFDPQEGTKSVTLDPSLSDEMKNYAKLYGGIIYGGCYNSGVVIGDVILNSIFMGSNGEHLVDDDMIKHINERNNFNIGSSDAILNKYFEAVDVEGLPKNFALADTITNVNIGSFFLGGNRGSMITDKTIELEFPENITIFGKIVGGSNNANYEYGTTAKHVGGLVTPLATGYTDKVHLKVRSKFLPKYLKYPDNDWRAATFEDNIRDDKGVAVYRKYENGVAKAYYKKVDGTDSINYTGKTYLPQGTCNIYGGCYNSGMTVGNIKIDLFSDMLLFGPEWKGVPETGKTDDEVLLALRTREQTVINCVDGLNDKSWHPFSVIGGGYGSGTSVYGDINVRLLPTITGTGTDRKASHPSCGNVFGGAQEGVVVGNTKVELRDGTVLANVYGASESSYMYGSTQIFIGYPEHYECEKSGEYKLARADIYSKAATLIDWQTNKNDNSEVVKRSVWYRKGDIVPKNVYEQIVAETANGDVTGKFIRHHEDAPNDFVPGATWDDINISVGDPSSRNARTAADIDSIPYFGYGNVYGGGFVPTAANSAFIGQKTLLRFKDTYKPINISDIPNGQSITSYGGNSAIMIWDNPENAERNPADTDYKYAVGGTATGGSGAKIKDHVSIGSGQFVEVKLKDGDNKMGLYYYKAAADDKPSEFVHQPSGNYSDEKDKGKTFYEIVGDGGIFGGGRKVYCEGFRACDLAYYGYADYTPQMAKLINSFQRIDLLSLTDCCLQLQASQDFASTTSDAGEQYSITRVGELRMNSSLAESNINLNAGVVDTLNIGNTNHNTPRSRNFLGFFRSVKFLGALVSNVDFTHAMYHDSIGVYKNDTTYSVKKDSIVSAYYKSAKGTDDYEKFKKRNVGTSANMIGINNGYSLRIQGTRQKKNSDNNDVDEAYYGPALGVTEIKLLTMAVGEGGGYVYALNKHEEKPAASLAQTKAATDSVTPSFLQTLGNFVFPGANFGLKQVEGVETPTLNYIIDDCFPIGHGYDEYIKEDKTNVNDAQEIHYWYVNGQRYFYNATLTAYTGTPDGRPDVFKLDNSDNLIMLAGIDSTTQYLRVKSIKWDVPTGYSYDLTRTSGMAPDSTEISSLLPGYNLYVSVGDKPQTLIKPSDTNKQNAWVAELKRTDYTLVDTIRDASDKVVFKEYYYDDLNIVPVIGNDNAGNGKYKATMPLLGLALTDSVANNAKDYYAEHLSQPAKVQVVLGAKNTDGDYEYTLNLTIVYLKGTDISGHIVIENCALPGERIYANAFDVKVEGDDPNITNRKWVLYKVNTTFDDNGDVVSTTPMEDVDISDNFLVEENSPERIAIPAYYWMNGWHLAYEMTVNGKHERVLTSLSNDTEHPVITVHNYHRMMAWDRKTKTSDNKPDIQDLQLTSGARVYIEDADDLEHFLIYMTDSVQDSRFGDTDALKKLHRGHIGTAYLDETYDDIVTVNPQYAESIHFILLNDVKMKENAAQSFKFAGRLSGLGHTIDLNNCTQFMGENGTKGSIYFTGFLSKGETKVIGTNNGRVFGCFNYNTNHTGKLIDTVGDDDNLQYSFQNSYPNEKDHYNYTTYYDDLDFANGKAAYDLNAFYLNERYKKATGQPGNENDRFKSYVYNYYGDGDYRYANWDRADRIGTATALRTDAHPNYYSLARITAEEMDALTGVGAEVSAGIGAAAFSRAKTYHNCDHTPDGSRNYVTGHYVDVNVDGVEQSEWIPDYYEPNYPQDFMFWGQDIKAGEQYPKTIATDGTNRVFRASGFYGSQEDKGFYFNRAEAVMQHPRLTAVDFTGQRMRDGAGEYKLNKQVFPTSGTRKQTIIFPPVLDLPTNGKLFEGTTDATAMQLGSMSVVGNVSIDSVNKVTKNLLVYIPSDKVTEVQFPQNNDESEIIAHRIDWNSTTEKYSTEQFHLVDKQDFNAPIAFHADSIWYERVPEKFSSGDNAWESLSLPFTAKNVRARATSAVTTNDNSHGLLTHFFGKDKEDVYGDGTPRSHEYWLRKFTGMETDKNIAKFHRPRSEQDSINNGVSKKVNMSNTASGSGSRNNNEGEELINFHYSNTYYSKAYGTDGYIQDPSHIRPQYTTEGVYYKDYPLITAGFPYIVTYPGVRYYEFDLSGEFYKKYNPMSDATPQIISYENSNYDVPVTDSIRKVFEHDNYKFVSAFMHEDSTAYRANPVTEIEKDNNDAEKMDANGVYKIMSTTFESNTPIIPFRAYLSSETAFNNIAINTRTISLDDEDSDEQEEKYTGVNLYVRGTDLIVTSDHDFILPLYGISGQLYRNLPVRAGMNVYHNLNTGVYVALGHKFVVRSR